MIASLNGEVLSIALDHAVIECGGVGYQFLATPRTLGTLVRGDRARVMTSLAVKEDAMTLYGFTADEDRAMFHQLQVVSGLGPKLALACLSVLEPGEIATAINNGDAKKLQTIPGVGKRMSERMALELKDKVKGFITQPAGDDASAASQSSLPVGSGAMVDTVVEALVGLGFTEKASRPVVEAFVAESENTETLETATVLRASLAALSGKK
ncbi:Holliday junction branch migration protein RuvA [Corynebacterium sp. J010B-136]|uniref:Holliday junction branch migration protein RuvA n=1 Tax=Corynebacterium sp. J010B-136 TaxID=2099401 RepID=UPI000CF86350|nr:Holliday junction branch migration protein RuvA [Corynebacterium sp. J010B-136]PQM74667.1 Holliday junction branch migration protein RuvA [Corynebacterium sp. J010B-136]